MIYLKTKDDGLRVLVLESGNLDQLRAGRPAVAPDKSVIVAYTPDPVWLADRLLGVPDGDLGAVARLIDEASRRPQKDPARPSHAPHAHTFPSPEGPTDA